MGTRSTITVLCKDGNYRSVYCHWDGYPTYNGKMLLSYYNTQEQAEALVRLGDISSLDASIECPPGHSWDKPIKGYTTFYGRDRGEDRTECSVGPTVQQARSRREEYNYVWDGAQWCWDGGVLFPEVCGLPAKPRARTEVIYGLYEVINNSLNSAKCQGKETLLDVDTNSSTLIKRANAYFSKPENLRANNVQYVIPEEVGQKSNSWKLELPYRSGGCVMTNEGYCIVRPIESLVP